MTVYFEGLDSSDNETLWVSNGTASGTSEVSVPGAYSTGIFAGVSSPNFTHVANNDDLFIGRDSSDHLGLWATNGAGAAEFTISGANGMGIFAIPNPFDIIYFNGELLYSGEDNDATPMNNLWVNNKELVVSGAASNGLQPADMEVFNNLVVFTGLDMGDVQALYTFNGASVSEITGITGANAGGVADSDFTDFTTFGNEVLFSGFDTSNHFNLWVTNGTTAGTSELSVPTEPSKGLFNVSLNPDFTIFNGKVVFEAFDDNAGDLGLWVTNGTGAGTSEVAQFHNTFGGGPDFIVYNNEVLFEAKDSGGNDGLWVFNGSTASEITGINGANSGGIFNDGGVGEFPGFTLANGEVLFDGWGSGGVPQLWETDGTAGGTHAIIPVNNAYVDGLDPQDLALVPPTPDDFNDDGTSDMLWRNSSGTLAEWQMNGAAIASSVSPTFIGTPVSPDASWSIAGVGDVNGDGAADILWRQNTGALAEWEMNGSAISSSTTPKFQGAAVSPDSSWSVAGMGDFNGAGDDDILWRQNSGTLVEWLMNGSTIMASVSPTFGANNVAPDPSWSVAGIGDFNGDGNSDILWRQSSSGALAEWEMSGSTITSSVTPNSGGIPVTPDSTWNVVGVGDFNGDGYADMLWRQTGSGTLAMWLMNGSTISQSASPKFGGIAVTPDSTWNIVEVGDFSGGNADVIWQQSTTGSLVEWVMNGSTITASNAITAAGTPVAPGSTWSSQAKPTDFA